MKASNGREYHDDWKSGPTPSVTQQQLDRQFRNWEKYPYIHGPAFSAAFERWTGRN